MEQYDSYSSIPQTVRDLVANKISLLDQYVLMQTGEYEYTALIYDASTGQCQQIRVFRSGTNYSAYYQVEISEGVWDWSVNNEYYCYSNMGIGSALDLPVVEGATAHATVIICVAMMFAIVFKGVLFPWTKRK